MVHLQLKPCDDSGSEKLSMRLNTLSRGTICAASMRPLQYCYLSCTKDTLSRTHNWWSYWDLLGQEGILHRDLRPIVVKIEGSPVNVADQLRIDIAIVKSTERIAFLL
jgi:hypothetical protein